MAGGPARSPSPRPDIPSKTSTVPSKRSDVASKTSAHLTERPNASSKTSNVPSERCNVGSKTSNVPSKTSAHLTQRPDVPSKTCSVGSKTPGGHRTPLRTLTPPPGPSDSRTTPLHLPMAPCAHTETFETTHAATACPDPLPVHRQYPGREPRVRCTRPPA